MIVYQPVVPAWFCRREIASFIEDQAASQEYLTTNDTPPF
jgi:hypothetical protein